MFRLFLLGCVLLVSACAPKYEEPTQVYTFQVYDFKDVRDNRNQRPLFEPAAGMKLIIDSAGAPVMFGGKTALLFPTLKEYYVDKEFDASGAADHMVSYEFHFVAKDGYGRVILDDDLICVASGTQVVEPKEVLKEVKEALLFDNSPKEDKIIQRLSRECLMDIGHQLGVAVVSR